MPMVTFFLNAARSSSISGFAVWGWANGVSPCAIVGAAPHADLARGSQGTVHVKQHKHVLALALAFGSHRIEWEKKRCLR